MRRRWIRGLLVATFILGSAISTRSTEAAPKRQVGFNADKVTRATVSITQVYTNPKGQVIKSCIGSGTLVSADGLILTNAHIVQQSDLCRSDRIVVGLTINPGQPAVATYNAQVVETNLGWDLAVLRITNTIDGRLVDRNTLSLPYVQIGDSNTVQLDSTINVAGFAVTESELTAAAQVVRGTVSGFTAETRVGDRAWIKTSVPVPGGMTGGGAYDVDGNLIGVPTVEPSGGGSASDCRHVQDSNGDGHVDDKDTCIPVSGFVNSMRPARLARGLVLAAQLGIIPGTKPPSQPEPTSGDTPAFSRLFFAPGVNEADMPSTVVTAMPAGTKSLYLFFDYNNMREGIIYELRTTLDGVPNPIFSLAPATWSGGRQGLWYIGSTAQTWPNGNYEFSLFINGVRSASQQIVIGGNPPPQPSFSDILFGSADTGVGGAVSLVNAGNILPVGNSIHAEFVYDNMNANVKWSESWYYEGRQINPNPVEEAWTQGSNGKFAIDASPGGQQLQPGRYRLELRIGDRLAATSDFIMGGGNFAQKADVFTPPVFTADPRINTPLPAGAKDIQQLYATFNWRALNPGTPWMWRWSVDNNVLFEVTQPWTDATDGANYWLRLESQGHLPDGSYKVELIVAGLVMNSATAKIGSGLLPIGVFTVPTGVQLQGTITDAETGRGIAGVTVIVLKGDFDTRGFSWNMSEVYAMATTDSEGKYTLSTLLVPQTDRTYSTIIIAQGYLPVVSDSLIIRVTTKSPLTMNIELNRD